MNRWPTAAAPSPTSRPPSLTKSALAKACRSRIDAPASRDLSLPSFMRIRCHGTTHRAMSRWTTSVDFASGVTDDSAWVCSPVLAPLERVVLGRPAVRRQRHHRKYCARVSAANPSATAPPTRAPVKGLERRDSMLGSSCRSAPTQRRGGQRRSRRGRQAEARADATALAMVPGEAVRSRLAMPRRASVQISHLLGS
jgi:hypothetical protein